MTSREGSSSGFSALARALAGMFGERDEAPEPAKPKSAAQIRAERRRYANECMLLGLEACQRHDARRAVDTFHEALVAFQATGDRRAASLIQKTIGLVAQKIETPLKVRAALGQARKLLEQAGLRDEEARALFLLADYEARRGDFEVAYPLYEESLQITREIAYILGEVECLCRYGWALRSGGRADDAKRRILEARKAAHDDGDEALIARVAQWTQKFREGDAPPTRGARTLAEAAPPSAGVQRPWKPIGAAPARPIASTRSVARRPSQARAGTRRA